MENNILLELTGTEKQIKLAEDIRKQALKIFEQEAVLFNNQEFKEKYENWKMKNNIDAYSMYDNYKSLQNETNASKWINMRSIFEEFDDIQLDKIKTARNKQKKGSFIATLEYLRNRYEFFF